MITAFTLLVLLAFAFAEPPRTKKSSTNTPSDVSYPNSLKKFEYSVADWNLKQQLNCSVYVIHESFIRLQNGSLILPGSDEELPMGSYFLKNDSAIACDEGVSGTTEAASEFPKHLSTCGMFDLEADEYTLREDGDIYVAVYDKTYRPGEYWKSGDRVYVCVPDFDELKQNATSNQTFSDDYFNKFPDSFSYLTYTGLMVSIVSLLLHLFVFCTVSAVRNLPGYSLASLSLSLLMAYICFMAIAVLDGESCTGLGLGVYYFFLCAFFWMNAIAFDIWRSFRVVMKELRITSHRVPWRRFLVYSIYSWLIPAALTVLVRISDTTDMLPEQYRPDFGQAYCWFGRRLALLIFFAVPLVCVMLLNAAFFLDVTFIISRASLKTSQSHEKTLRKRFFMFLRLALIMGLTWIVGLIAGYADNLVMWYVFIALNTLQGLFIFAVFSCSSKVRQLCFKSCCGRQRSVRTSVSTSVRTISQASAAV